ncbi:MAG: ATP-binding cassette domain-containing protein [Lachnospiraceae bacterium]|nr:ATP-binding cassette domain-containing protein [Lachnospiraceae bacterium]
MEESMEAVNYAIEVKNVGLKIKKDVILKGINVNFEKGKIHGIVGRNGCGKTMLMKCICGFVKPTDGEVFVEGKKIGKDVDFPQNVGIIIETPGFVPYYSGYRNLKILAGLRKKIGKEEIMDILKQVGLEGAENKLVRKYSLGMRQRLGLAQSMMEKPDIFILDEPMNGLDNEGVEEMRVILKGLKEEGKTILLVSHNSEDISILSDEIYYMDKGTMEKGKKS